MIHFFARISCACCLLLCLLPGCGFAAAKTPGLTLHQAISATLARNPELQSSAFALRAADARIVQSDVAPAPRLALEAENFGGSGRASGSGSMETTFMLSQVLELGGKREQRAETARAHYGVLSLEDEARRLDLLAEVTRRFIHVASDQKQIDLSKQAVRLARQNLRAVEARVNAARSPDVELKRAQIALTRAEIDREHTEHELLSSRRKLAAMWGDENADFDRVSADLFALPVVGDFPVLLSRLKNNPDFTRFAHEQRLRDAEVRLAETRPTPDIEISAGLRQFQETDDHGFVVSVSMPLFTGSRNRGAVAEANARQAQVASDERSAFLRAQAQLFELYQELNHALAEARMLREQVVPQTKAILQQTEYAYQRGRYSYIDWIAAQRELLDAQLSLIEAAANAHRYAAEIERLTGESLSDSVTP
jgi:cobalt-zinc-cadmium efflux system outer membrane protein